MAIWIASRIAADEAQAIFVGNMLAPPISHQAHLGALMTDYAGLAGWKLHHRSRRGLGRGALRMGYLAVHSGEMDAPWCWASKN